MQAAPGSRHGGWHDAVHVGSEQSAPFAQSSSIPFAQFSTVLSVQSSAQLTHPSPDSHSVFPQQNELGVTGTVVQLFPPDVQRESEQDTGFVPAPSPQQKRAVGFPF